MIFLAWFVFGFCTGFVVTDIINTLIYRKKNKQIADLEQINKKLNNELLRLSDERGLLEVERDSLKHDLSQYYPNGYGALYAKQGTDSKGNQG